MEEASRRMEPRDMGPEWETRGREAAAARSQKIQWVLISVASFWTCQFNYDASQLTAMHLEPITVHVKINYCIFQLS